MAVSRSTGKKISHMQRVESGFLRDPIPVSSELVPLLLGRDVTRRNRDGASTVSSAIVEVDFQFEHSERREVLRKTQLSLRSMDGVAIRERVQALRLEVAKIHAENRSYLQQPHHRSVDELLHKDREARLVQILKELTALTKKNPPD